MPRAGRPVSIIEINLNQIEQTVQHVTSLCSNDSVKTKVLHMCTAIKKNLVPVSTSSTQASKSVTDNGSQTFTEFNADSILNDIGEHGLSQEDIEYLYENLFQNLENKLLILFLQIKSLEDGEENKLFEALCKDFTNVIFACLEVNSSLIFEKIDSMSMDEQILLYGKMGSAFNDYIWRESNSQIHSNLSILDLKKVSKFDMWSKVDKRIAAFFTSMTAKKNRHKHKDNSVELANILESIFKSRNSRYVSLSGLKEHLVAYISSNKSNHVSDLFCHTGGRGNRHLLETIIDKSEIACTFQDPKKISVFVSFDNIQKLMKGHRLSEQEQQKVYGVIVTSILAVLPDGYLVDQIQYKSENNMTYWFSDFGYNKDKGIFYNQLDNHILKKMTKINPEDMEVIDHYWHQDLETELNFVLKDTSNTSDSIDMKVRENENKRIKLCTEGHVNRNPRGNRKICMHCKARLVEEDALEQSYFIFENSDNTDAAEENTGDKLSPEEECAIYYMKVENIKTEHQPVDKSMGAIPINPNNLPRIKKVLDEIKSKTGMDKYYSVELNVEDEKIVKRVIKNDEVRSWILLSCDGLPMKSLIQLIENMFQCIDCGQKIEHVSELSEHARSTQHKSFFQIYSCFCPNVGQFHYQMTMNRSFIKFLWKIEYEQLCKAVNLSSPKAMVMIEKGTDFRKSMDFIMSARKAKLREMLYPFVKYCKTENVVTTVSNFLRWVKEKVKSKTFLSAMNIEHIFGTSLLLFRSSYRANNLKVLRACKSIFSRLFHINNNTMYMVLDMWSQYHDLKMQKNNPEMYNYLQTRLFCNKSGRPYHSEGMDEFHEEFNRKGMRFQQNRDEESFAKSFIILNDYAEMRDAMFGELGINKNTHQHFRKQNLEPNIHDMRVMMRSKQYLSNPENEESLVTLSGEALNEDILEILEISGKVRQENIVQVMNKSSFFERYQNKQVDFLKDGTFELDYDEQIKVLIGSNENDDERNALYSYWQDIKKSTDYDEESFLNNLLENKIFIT